MAHHLRRVLTSAAAGALLLTGLAPAASADSTPPPQPATDNAVTADAAPLWDENGYIVASNQAELNNAIAKAREAGVTVTTSEQKLDAVASNDAEQAKTRIERSNAEAIKALNTAVTKQQEYNLAFETKLKEELKKVLEVESNKGLVLGDEVDWDSLSVITPATKERDENHKFALNSDGRDLITAKKVTAGPTSTVTPTPSAKPVVKRSLAKTGTSTALALSAAGSALLAGALLLSRRRSRS